MTFQKVKCVLTAGGIIPVALKIKGICTYLKGELGYFFDKNQKGIGKKKPIKKNQLTEE